MPITDEVRKYRETALEQGKVVRKPWYAAVGAGNVAYGRLTKLPDEVQTRVRKLRADRRQLDASTLREAVETATTRSRKAYEGYAAQARETYQSLAHRGEIVVRRMRRSHEVKGTFERAEHVVAEAGRAVATAEEKVTHPGPMTTTAPKPAAKTAPAHTAATHTAPAHKPAAHKAPAHKAPAKHAPHS